ncbi:MAG: holo-ACP synthase [candidate division WOR-3 bacterium]
MAIFGVGIDLVEIGRVRNALVRYGDRFRNRIFTAAEVSFCERVSGKFLSYAGRFAAKEAFSKALGTGLRGAIGWREVEVLDNERSRPTITVTGRAQKFLGDRKVHLSITHLSDYAAAVVVIEE